MDSDEHPARTQTTFVPNRTIRLCPVCVPSPVFPPTSRATPAHFCAQPHDPALPRLRTFARIPTHEPPHACAPSPVFRPPSRATPAHLRPHSHPRASPRLRTFVRIPTSQPPHVCAPPSSFLRTFSPTSTYFFTRFYVPVRQIIKRIYTNHLKYSYKSFKQVI